MFSIQHYVLLTEGYETLRNQFYDLQTPEDVAALLDIEYKQLQYLLYHTNHHQRYTTFIIPKASGEDRCITAPTRQLKALQRSLNNVFQDVYRVKPSVHGFVHKRSIRTNAEAHIGKRYILNIDIQNFFPAINFGRVRGLFMGPPYHRPPSVATVLAQLCCHANQLPQGAPTSPIVANMICAKLDSQLQHTAQTFRCYYTRYADDMTFSTNIATFPSALAIINALGQIEIGPTLTQVIRDNGFQINQQKVRLQQRRERQEVTGLTVNKFPNVNRSYIRQIRAMLYAWGKFGEAEAQREFLHRYDRKRRYTSSETPIFRFVVKGKIAFLGMIRGTHDPLFLRFCRELKALAPELVRNLDDLVHADPEEITRQQNLLTIYRRRLAHSLKRKAIEGVAIPYSISHDIRESREEIRRLKRVLHEWGAVVTDHPDDDGS